MAGIKIDESRFPIVEITYEGVPTIEDNARMRSTIESYWAAGKSYVSISDLTYAGKENKAENKKMAEWTAENRETLRKYCKGTALIVPSVMLRSVIRTFFFMSKPAFPYEVVETREEAEKFIAKCLERQA